MTNGRAVGEAAGGYTAVRLRDDWEMRVAVDDPDAQMPGYSHAGDAGMDLYTSIGIRIPSGQFRDVECGIRVQLPKGIWGRITGRSSTLRRRGLLVNDAVIDNGYVGPIYVGVWNLGEHAAEVGVGERLAQLILHPITRFPIVAVSHGEMLDSRDGRGTGGFGSTGA